MVRVSTAKVASVTDRAPEVGVVRRERRSHHHLEHGALELLHAARPRLAQSDLRATTCWACCSGLREVPP